MESVAKENRIKSFVREFIGTAIGFIWIFFAYDIRGLLENSLPTILKPFAFQIFIGLMLNSYLIISCLDFPFFENFKFQFKAFFKLNVALILLAGIYNLVIYCGWFRPELMSNGFQSFLIFSFIFICLGIFGSLLWKVNNTNKG